MPEQGVAAMVITPGADLRYVAGYDAKPLERSDRAGHPGGWLGVHGGAGAGGT
jgi:hypothetical protein